MESIVAVVAGFVLIIGVIALHQVGIGLDSWREYRAGRAVDKTAEWQQFKDAFEVEAIDKQFKGKK